MSIFHRVRSFYDNRFEVGDRLGEMFYGVWMAVVSLGILNTGSAINDRNIATVIGIAFGVNFVWGLIDGVTVMYTGIIGRAQTDKLVHALRARRDDPVVRRRARARLDDTLAADLGDAEKERIIDQIAAGDPGADPAQRRYRPSFDDWLDAAAICAIDVVLVIPVVAPLVVIDNVPTAVYVSRLVSTAIFAGIGALYALHLHRNARLAALFLGAVGFGVFTLAYHAGY